MPLIFERLIITFFHSISMGKALDLRHGAACAALTSHPI